MTRPVDRLLSRLDKVRQIRSRNEWWACCPVHDDKNPSLHVTQKDDGMLVMHCFGCGANGSQVMESLGLALGDLFPSAPHTLTEGRDDWNPRKKPAKWLEEIMQDEIYRLRAELRAK